ncbi:autophagy protein Apg6 family protein [Blastocystis sp. ATCC 50177/Nand II]|uniref:Autophagy protein Apg6 family protein n=1 Tax=Blastocystis sp. subtype 1 (strain ATCC 50177 / NandII) TaxID=478820 RepID=A0A196SCA9_BLAHN|nr:autophagy protein Apg6 family protein [Blastocystis sp. ATCC 50177/Nand II]
MEELSPNGNEEEHTKGETTKNQNELQKEKEELSSAIQSLREDLASVEREKMELEEVQAELGRLRDAMNCVSSEIGLTLGMHSGETNRAVEKTEKDAELLRLLKGCNPLNDAFNIWFDREAITVNGMKLARVGNQIDWNSVNGVLGELLQVVDALHTLYGKRYEQIVLKPQGAASEVIDLTQKTSYKLCFNPKGGNRKLFQQALHLLLEEVKVLVAHCAEKFKVEVKYPIQQDAVNGCDFLCGDYDVWCKAVRYLAIDIKQLIVYSSSAIICFAKK